MTDGAGRQAFIAAVLCCLTAACGTTIPLPTPPPPALLAAAQAACQPSDLIRQAGIEGDFETAVAIDAGGGGGLLQVAPFPDDPTYIYINLCTFVGDSPAEVNVAGVTTIQVDARPTAPFAVDGVIFVNQVERLAAGRVPPGVDGVEVQLDDGRELMAVRSGCHWLASWSGSSNPAIFRSLDAAGDVLGTVNAPFIDQGSDWTPTTSPPHSVTTQPPNPGCG